MKSEDTRNLFLAIALSVLVMAAWQYFYAGPLYQRQHQAQLQAQTEAAQQAQQAASVAGATPKEAGASRSGRSRRPRRRRDRVDPGCARGEPARRHRHAERGGLDRPQGRQVRRPRAQGLPRDHQQRESADPAFVAERRARRLLGDDRLCRRGRRKDADARHGLDLRWEDADADPTRDPDLGQRRGARLQARHLGRRQIHVHRRRFGHQQGRRARDGQVLRARAAPRQAQCLRLFRCCTKAL